MQQTYRRQTGIIIVGAFAVIAGLGEIVVGFTGNYVGILTHSLKPSFATGLIGAFYSLGGLSLLITKKKGAPRSACFSSALNWPDVFILRLPEWYQRAALTQSKS